MPTNFTLPLHRFDTNLLPPDARQIGSEAFKSAVVMHFAAEYAAKGQTAIVTVDDSEITVMAFPAEASALDFVMPMLKAGKIAEAVPYLESLTKSRTGRCRRCSTTSASLTASWASTTRPSSG
jgi:hypothetical protein